MRNLHQLFVLCTANQIIGGDFVKFCGLLRIYELYVEYLFFQKEIIITRIFMNTRTISFSIWGFRQLVSISGHLYIDVMSNVMSLRLSKKYWSTGFPNFQPIKMHIAARQ